MLCSFTGDVRNKRNTAGCMLLNCLNCCWVKVKLLTGDSSMDVAVLLDGHPNNSKCNPVTLFQFCILVNGGNVWCCVY